MARIFTDGAEAGDLHFFTMFLDGGSTMHTVSTTRRSGNYAYAIVTPEVFLKLPATYTEFYLRMGLRNSVNNTSSANRIAWCSALGASNVDTALGGLSITSGKFTYRRRTGTTTFTASATGTTTIALDTWYLVEIYILIHATAGRVHVKINGTTDIDYTGQTTYTTLTSVGALQFAGTGSTGLTLLDDLAMNDTTGERDNSWVGDGKVIALRPNADGSTIQMLGTDGDSIDNYAIASGFMNRETYLKAFNPGDKDIYLVESPTPISGYTGIARVWAEGRLGRSILSTTSGEIGILTNGTEVYGSGAAMEYGPGIIRTPEYERNPVTDHPWTNSDITNIQVISKRSST